MLKGINIVKLNGKFQKKSVTNTVDLMIKAPLCISTKIWVLQSQQTLYKHHNWYLSSPLHGLLIAATKSLEHRRSHRLVHDTAAGAGVTIGGTWQGGIQPLLAWVGTICGSNCRQEGESLGCGCTSTTMQTLTPIRWHNKEQEKVTQKGTIRESMASG